MVVYIDNIKDNIESFALNTINNYLDNLEKITDGRIKNYEKDPNKETIYNEFRYNNNGNYLVDFNSTRYLKIGDKIIGVNYDISEEDAFISYSEISGGDSDFNQDTLVCITRDDNRDIMYVLTSDRDTLYNGRSLTFDDFTKLSELDGIYDLNYYGFNSDTNESLLVGIDHVNNYDKKVKIKLK